MLSNDKYRTVKLFIENLHWGKISLNTRLMELNYEHIDKIHNNIALWAKLDNLGELNEMEDIDFELTTEELYNNYMYGRIDGSIEGELKDESFEKRIKELEEEKNKNYEKITELTYQRDQAIAELARLRTTEPPLKKDFNALR